MPFIATDVKISLLLNLIKLEFIIIIDGLHDKLNNYFPLLEAGMF
jgi:hypothetical protein